DLVSGLPLYERAARLLASGPKPSKSWRARCGRRPTLDPTRGPAVTRPQLRRILPSGYGRYPTRSARLTYSAQSPPLSGVLSQLPQGCPPANAIRRAVDKPRRIAGTA